MARLKKKNVKKYELYYQRFYDRFHTIATKTYYY